MGGPTWLRLYWGSEGARHAPPVARARRGTRPADVCQAERAAGLFGGVAGKALRGLSAQKYRETVVEAAQAFGVSPTSVSTHLIEVTTQKLKDFKE